MWKWILGAVGAAGVAGVALAGRDDKQDERKRRREDNRFSLDAASLDGGEPERTGARDRKKTSAPRLTGAGSSYWDAFELADEPGLAEDEQARRAEARKQHTQALGRIIASESGTMSRVIKRVVGWIARNRSLLVKRVLFDMAAPGGDWGPISAKRPMASSQPATEETLATAADVLAASQAEDPTIGATHGFDKSLQNRLAEQGIVTNDADLVMQVWESFYGLRPIGQIENWVLYR